MIETTFLFIGIFLKNYLLFGTGYVIGHIIGLLTNELQDLITFRNVINWYFFYPYFFAIIVYEKFKK